MVVTHHIRNSEPDFSELFASHSGDKTMVYKTAHGLDLTLSLYFPQDFHLKRLYPLFLMIHGGGWTSRAILPDQSEWQGDYLGYLARYYSHKGYVVASIDYRMLGQGNSLEDLIRDCADACDYLLSYKMIYGLDFERVTLLGESAGGYLAAALATFAELSISFQRLILVNSITDMTTPPWNAFGPSPIEESLRQSPVHRISSYTPPTLLLHGTADVTVSVEHSRDFYKEMFRLQRPAQLHLLEGIGHAFLLAEYQLQKNRSAAPAGQAIEIIDRWLESV